jgi:hypothetical protein
MDADIVIVVVLLSLMAIMLLVIAVLLEKIYGTLSKSTATEGQIIQLGGSMGTPAPGTINGVPLGGSGTFQFTPNGTIGGVPVWSTGDPSVTLTPSADGMSCVASVSPTETLTGFGLSVAAVGANGVFNTSAQVPVLPAVPPPPPPLTATAGVITQIA